MGPPPTSPKPPPPGWCRLVKKRPGATSTVLPRRTPRGCGTKYFLGATPQAAPRGPASQPHLCTPKRRVTLSRAQARGRAAVLQAPEARAPRKGQATTRPTFLRTPIEAEKAELMCSAATRTRSRNESPRNAHAHTHTCACTRTDTRGHEAYAAHSTQRTCQSPRGPLPLPPATR